MTESTHHHGDRLRLLESWLRKNVVRFPDSADLEVAAIDIDSARYPRELCGRLIVHHKGIALEPWHFSVQVTGRTCVSPPLFTSPLGVPASFPMYDVSPEALERIAREVEQRLPPFRGLRQEDSGNIITERIDPSFDLLAWERSKGLCTPTSAAPRTPPISATAEPQQAQPPLASPAHQGQRGNRSFAAVAFLLLAIPFQLILLLVITPMLVLFGALGLVDREAVRLGGRRYLDIRDRTAELLLKGVAILAIVGLMLVILAECSRGADVECDWDRRGANCYQG